MTLGGIGIGLEKVHNAGPNCASHDGLTTVKSADYLI